MYIDEIDKITRKREYVSVALDVSGEGVQETLLKLLEESTIDVLEKGGHKNPRGEYITIDTTDILFYLWWRICRSRKTGDQCTAHSSTGFSASMPNMRLKDSNQIGKLLPHAELEDIVSYGLMPDFIGRFPLLVSTTGLSKDEMMQVLTKLKNNVFRQ